MPALLFLFFFFSPRSSSVVLLVGSGKGWDQISHEERDENCSSVDNRLLKANAFVS